MRQKHENYFSMRLKSVGGHFTADQLGTIQKISDKIFIGDKFLFNHQ